MIRELYYKDVVADVRGNGSVLGGAQAGQSGLVDVGIARKLQDVRSVAESERSTSIVGEGDNALPGRVYGHLAGPEALIVGSPAAPGIMLFPLRLLLGSSALGFGISRFDPTDDVGLCDGVVATNLASVPSATPAPLYTSPLPPPRPAALPIARPPGSFPDPVPPSAISEPPPAEPPLQEANPPESDTAPARSGAKRAPVSREARTALEPVLQAALLTACLPRLSEGASVDAATIYRALLSAILHERPVMVRVHRSFFHVGKKEVGAGLI